MRTLLLLICMGLAAQTPPGFEAIFNGKNLTGWHISQVNHHGNTKAWTVQDSVLAGTQDTIGNGGILLTDKKYRDFEISLEIKPDWGCDGGLFLRSSEKGEAYQVMIDYLGGEFPGQRPGGNVSGINPEAIRTKLVGTGKRMDSNWLQYWKVGDWNHLRARIEGDVPHIQVWLNGTQTVDWTDDANHLPDGAVEGMIALQVHLSRRSGPDKNPRWKAGGYHRFRNIFIKELNK